MPFLHGKNAAIYLDAVSLSPFLNAADVAYNVDPGETTAFQSTWKTFIAGTAAAKADLAGYYDPADLTFRNLVGVDPSLTGGLLTIVQGSAATPAIGDRAHLLSVMASTWAESSPVGGVIAIKASAMSSGVVGPGIILHPLSEDTNTTTGADRDDTAQTTTGWTAHLHVILVDGGSWVIKLQDAATLPTYADVTGGSFASVSGPAKQRLVSASGATLRRFVRYVATRTGGSAGDGITFALAYSRNS